MSLTEGGLRTAAREGVAHLGDSRGMSALIVPRKNDANKVRQAGAAGI